jgi:hypothetical protein
VNGEFSPIDRREKRDVEDWNSGNRRVVEPLNVRAGIAHTSSGI